jgi:hypothetical protein
MPPGAKQLIRRLMRAPCLTVCDSRKKVKIDEAIKSSVEKCMSMKNVLDQC